MVSRKSIGLRRGMLHSGVTETPTKGPRASMIDFCAWIRVKLQLAHCMTWPVIAISEHADLSSNYSSSLLTARVQSSVEIECDNP